MTATEEPGDREHHLRREVELAARTGDRFEEARALNRLAVATARRGAHEEALAALDRALELCPRSGAPDTMGVRASALVNRGQLRALGSRESEALADFDDALAIREEQGDVGGQVAVLAHMGYVAQTLGWYGQALSHYGEAMARLRAALETARPDEISLSTASRAAILNNLAALYHDLGEPERSIAGYEQAADLFEQADNPVGQIAALVNVATLREERGDSQASRELYREAIGRSRACGHRYGEAAALTNLGRSELDTGSPRGAMETLERAVDSWRLAADAVGEAAATFNLACAHRKLGDDQAAESLLTRALEIAREHDDRDGQRQSLAELGSLLTDRGDVRGLGYFADALEITEATRIGLEQDRLRQSYFARGSDVHADYARALLSMAERDREPGASRLRRQAFVVAERRRARELLDFLRRAHVGSAAGIAPDLADRLSEGERRLQATIARRLAEAGGHTTRNPVTLQALDREIAERRLELSALEAEAAETAPGFRSLIEQPWTDVEAVQDRLLDTRSALVSYTLTAEVALGFAVTAEEYRAWTLPVGLAQIEAWVNALRAWIETQGEGVPPHAMELSAVLVQPALDALSTSVLSVRRLLLVPDGPLHLLPFAVLPAGVDGASAVLGDHYHLAFSSSASAALVLDERRRGGQPADGTLIAFGDPLPNEPPAPGGEPPRAEQRELDLAAGHAGAELDRLLHARDEVAGIAKELRRGGGGDIEVHLGVENTKAAAQRAFDPSAARRWRYVHFATHAVVDPLVPELSGLVFSPAGDDDERFWRAFEILASRLDCELAVASACETARGKLVAGEGPLSLARVFLFAGAEQACVSLWKVPDRATSELMVEFYRALADGLPADEALGRAQRSLRDGPFHRPLHWAGFVLVR